MAKNNTTKYLLIGGALYAAYYLLKKPQQIKGIGKIEFDEDYLTRNINSVYELAKYLEEKGDSSRDFAMSDAYYDALKRLFTDKQIKQSINTPAANWARKYK